MCGIIGIFSRQSVQGELLTEIIEGLISLQHRGQDSVGVASEYCIVKYPGLVKHALSRFEEQRANIHGKSCIGHVRYITNGEAFHSQPFCNSFLRRITLCHNGNIINLKYIRNVLKDQFKVEPNTKSDSEMILYLFCLKLYEGIDFKLDHVNICKNRVKDAVNFLHKHLVGSYNLLIIIENYGMIAIRDPKGIRPFIWGTCEDRNLVCSESVVLTHLGYKVKRDIVPGETIIFQDSGEIIHQQYEKSELSPCLFEYIYIARPDSIIDKICVHDARIRIGRSIAHKILQTWNIDEIDVIIPVPDTSVTFVNGIRDVINKPVREGLIKNRYIDRTFIMENNLQICKNIKRKLSEVESIFNGKNVMIVDDSIVRGNTSKHIINIARRNNAKKIFFVSCSPPIVNTNSYGINIPTCEELVSFNRTEEQIRKELKVDYLLYHNLETIISELKKMNSKIDKFEVSMFNK